MDEPVRVSIVVPVFNTSAFIGNSLRRLRDHVAQREWGRVEILAVDDGSTDGTPDVIRESFADIQVIRQERNRGKGAAVRRGMLEARGDFRIFIDADIPYDLDAMDVMLDYLDRKEFDIVVGTRSLQNVREVDARPNPARRLASWVFTELVSRIIVTGVRDTQCGFKGFRRHAAETLFSDTSVENFAFDVEVLYYAFKRDMDIKRVAVRLVASDHSSVSLVRHALPMLWTVLGVPLRYHFGGGKSRVTGATPGAR